MKKHTLCERVTDIPCGVTARRWSLLADEDAEHDGKVRLSESPLYLELHWRLPADGSEQEVGTFWFDLDGLLRDGYIRYDPKDSHGPDVRVRFVRDDGRFYLQTNRKGPRFLLP
jgi:hypothetical protein